MAQRYRPEEYEGGQQMRYRDQEGRRTSYRPEDWDDEPARREGGRQGWQGRLEGGEWQRQQDWELEGGPSSGEWPEARRGSAQQWPGGRTRRGAEQSDYFSEYDPYAMTPMVGRGGYGRMYGGGGMRGGMYRYGERGQGMPGPYTGRGPKGYHRSDERIKEDVCERLTRHPEVDAEDVEVDVRDGEVFLRGSVMDRYQKRTAEDAIEGVSGVKDIQNQLRIGMGAGEQEGAKPGASARRSTKNAGMAATGSRAGTSSVARGGPKGAGTGTPRTTQTSGTGGGTPPSPQSS